MDRACRLASTEFCLLALGLCFSAAVRAADAPAAVTPPKPVVIQPTAVMAPPPVPAAGAAVPQPAAKNPPARTAKKQTAIKPVGKPKPKAKRR